VVRETGEPTARRRHPVRAPRKWSSRGLRTALRVQSNPLPSDPDSSAGCLRKIDEQPIPSAAEEPTDVRQCWHESKSHRSCTQRLSVEGPACETDIGQVFWLPDHPPAAPSHGRRARSGLLQHSSPVTAAGPQRTCTVFPILLRAPRVLRDTQVERKRILPRDVGVSIQRGGVRVIS